MGLTNPIRHGGDFPKKKNVSHSCFRGVTEELPWAYCGEWWGADHACVSIGNLTDRQKQELTLQR